MTAHEPRVVVATDLSAASEQAVVQAHQWAQLHAARLVVLHVLPDLLPLQQLLRRAGDQRADGWDSQEQLAVRRVSDQVKRLTARADDQLDIVVRHGSPHAVIVELAEELNALLVVLAASSKAPLERVLLGSTAEQVVRHATAPVLVARASLADGPVLVATDLSDIAVGAVEVAVVEASRLDAPLAALYCLDVDRPLTATFNPFVMVDEATRAALHESAHETLKATLAGFSSKGETLVVDGDPKLAIGDVARDKNARLVVVGTHSTTGPVRFLLGSVALAVTRNAPCSVLVARLRAPS